MENDFDRWDRIGANVKILYEDDFEYLIRFKYGRPMLWPKHITILNTCDICNKKSTPKKVQERSDCWCWNVDETHKYKNSKHMLCMGCWNKIKSLQKKRTRLQRD